MNKILLDFFRFITCGIFEKFKSNFISENGSKFIFAIDRLIFSSANQHCLQDNYNLKITQSSVCILCIDNLIKIQTQNHLKSLVA